MSLTPSLDPELSTHSQEVFSPQVPKISIPSRVSGSPYFLHSPFHPEVSLPRYLLLTFTSTFMSHVDLAHTLKDSFALKQSPTPHREKMESPVHQVKFRLASGFTPLVGRVPRVP